MQVTFKHGADRFAYRHMIAVLSVQKVIEKFCGVWHKAIRIPYRGLATQNPCKYFR